MAKIDWSDEAISAFVAYVKNARLEFGETTAKRWIKERKNIESLFSDKDPAKRDRICT